MLLLSYILFGAVLIAFIVMIIAIIVDAIEQKRDRKIMKEIYSKRFQMETECLKEALKFPRKGE